MIIRALECNLTENILPPSYYTRGYLREFEDGNVARKLELIRTQGWTINHFDQTGNTALHTAVSRKEARFVEAIMTYKGLNLNYQNTSGLTPLLMAAQLNRFEIYKLLLKAGASPFYADVQDATVLIMAAKNGNSELIAFTLDFLNYQKLKNADTPKKKLWSLESCFSGHKEQRKIQVLEEAEAVMSDLLTFSDENKRSFMEYLLRMNLNDFSAFMKRPEVFKAFAFHNSTLLNSLILTANGKNFQEELAKFGKSEADLDAMFAVEGFVFDPSDALHELIRCRQAQIWAIKLIEAGALSYVDNAQVLQSAIKTKNKEIIDLLLKFNCKTVDEATGGSVFEFAAEENLLAVFETFPCTDPQILKKCVIKAARADATEVVQFLKTKYRAFEIPGLITMFMDERVDGRVFNVITENAPSTNMVEWKEVAWKLFASLQFKKISFLTHSIKRRPEFDELKQFIFLGTFRSYPNLKTNEISQLNRLRANIISTGVNVNSREADGRLPLVNTIKARDYYGVKMILSSPSVDVNLGDSDDISPLFVAAATNQFQIVKDLLAKGAITACITEEQMDYLESKSSNDILKLLQQT